MAERIERINQKVLIYDHETAKYVEGLRTDVRSYTEIVTLKFSIAATVTDKPPEVGEVLNVDLASLIVIQLDTTAAANVSDDVDLNVESSLDGQNWDTEPYAERNIGDNKIKTFLVEPGPRFFRFRADNNHASNAAYLIARVMVRH